MKPKLELSVSEMMQLRKDGYSNKDIANILDISLPTVYRYIGKQNRHMESMATSTTPPEKFQESTIQPPQITVVCRVVSIDGYLFELPTAFNTISVSFADVQSVKINDLDRFINALELAKGYMNTKRTPNE